MRTLGCLLVGLLCIGAVLLFGVYGFALVVLVLLLAMLFRKAR